MMNPDASHEHLAELWTGATFKVVLTQFFGDEFSPRFVDNAPAFQDLGDVPAFVAVKAKDERGRIPFFLCARAHRFELFREKFVADPDVDERDLAFVRLNERKVSIRSFTEPVYEFDRVADRGGDEQGSHMGREQTKRKFPHDAALGVGELVKLVHNDGGDVVKREMGFRRIEVVFFLEVFGDDGDGGNLRRFRLFEEGRALVLLQVFPRDGKRLLGG